VALAVKESGEVVSAICKRQDRQMDSTQRDSVDRSCRIVEVENTRDDGRQSVDIGHDMNQVIVCRGGVDSGPALSAEGKYKEKLRKSRTGISPR
jgi:hypothetical protein